MRWLPLVTLLASAASFADAPPRPPPATWTTWATWVGDWQGKLRWAGCTVDGEPAASIALDAVDGVVAIDLTPAGGALGSVALEPSSDGGWRGRSGDVTVHLARGLSTLEVAVELESGCSVHGSLGRASVGIAACDELEAWARIENRCTRLVKPPLEDFARVARQRAEWSKASGEARDKLAAQCKARAAKVETELAGAGCVPGEPEAPARFPECAALRLAAAKVARCQTVPFDVATSLAHDANALADATAGIDSDSSRNILEKQCRVMRQQLVQSASGCGM